MNRRIFLKNGSLALVSLGFAPKFVAEAAAAAQTKQKVLVAVFQRGAVDGLNMVVPHGEDAYRGSKHDKTQQIPCAKVIGAAHGRRHAWRPPSIRWGARQPVGVHVGAQRSVCMLRSPFAEAWTE